MKENRGFSLVEVLIVVAIMGIMIGFVFIGLPLLTGQHAKKCANNMSAALGKEKNYALARSGTADCYMELLLDADGYHVKYYIPKNAVVTGAGPSDWVLAEDEVIGSQQVEVTCELEGGTSLDITTGQSLKLVYDRASGACKPSFKGDGSGVGLIDSYVDHSTRITIDRGKKYEITLLPDTGKHMLEKKN